MTELHKLSPSTINLLKDCPRCFWLSYNGVKRPRGIFPSLPSGMDKVLKEHFDSFMAKGKLPPELKSLKGVKLFTDKAKLDIWRNNFKGIQWDTKDFKLKGAVDNILEKGKKLIVLDYKTRGFPVKEDTHTHYIDQLALYNFLLRKNGYKTEDYSYLIFYHPKNVLADGSVVFHDHLIKIKTSVKDAEKLLNKAVKVLKGKEPKAAEKCEYCKYRK